MGLGDFMLNYFRLLSGWVTVIITTCTIWIPISFVLLRLFRTWIWRRAEHQEPFLRNALPDGQRPLIVGCFHPYCNAGGGGERVLWVAVRALQRRYSHVRCVIYTGDVGVSPDEILQGVRQRFNIVLPRTGPSDIHFAYLHRRLWVEASRYPFFTLLGQSLGSIVLGLEALFACVPDVYVDTMGYAFTMPVFRYLGGCVTACYVHYPTISTDMFERVAQRRATYNNAGFVSRSQTLSRVKVVYYKIFAWLYGIAGRRSDVVLVNSTWTYNHIVSLWQGREHTFIVHPPCDVQEFLTIPLTKDRTSDPQRTRTIISVAQFRPEKDHGLQLAAFSRFLKMMSISEQGKYRLVLIGGCRNEDDAARVHHLRTLASELNISDYVEFCLNVPFDELKRRLAEADVGLHTMWNEHFGIGVVECMAAGTVVLAHDSGGPKLDIVVEFNEQKTGFLASDVNSYSDALKTIFGLGYDEQLRIRTNARESIKKFSDLEFEEKFLHATQVLFY